MRSSIGVALAGLAPIKALLFLILLTRLRLRARTSVFAPLSLASTSDMDSALKASTSTLGFEVVLAGTALYDDELEELRAAGAEAAFNCFSEAGKGFRHDLVGVGKRRHGAWLGPDVSTQYEDRLPPNHRSQLLRR